MRQRIVRATSMAVICCLLIGCQAQPMPRQEPVQNLSALSSVRSIYVTELREDDTSHLIESSNLVRDIIQEGLIRSGRFTVVQDPAQADAILGGVAGVEPWYHGMEGYYGMEGDLDTHELGVGKLRLVDSKTKQMIWTYEYEAGFLNPHQSVAERVANQVVEHLVQDASMTITTN